MSRWSSVSSSPPVLHCFFKLPRREAVEEVGAQPALDAGNRVISNPMLFQTGQALRGLPAGFGMFSLPEGL